MESGNEYLSRPVKIFFTKSSAVAEGRMVFRNTPDMEYQIQRLRSFVEFRPSDPQKPGTVFSLFEISMIFYK